MGEGGEGVLGKIRAAVAAGVDWVQIREKDLSGRDLLALAREAVAGRGLARVIVNDRLDVALAAGAAGVHLGRESLSARDVVRWCRSGNAPAEFLIGVSCHGLEEAREAESAWPRCRIADISQFQSDQQAREDSGRLVDRNVLLDLDGCAIPPQIRQ